MMIFLFHPNHALLKQILVGSFLELIEPISSVFADFSVLAGLQSAQPPCGTERGY